MTDRIKLIWDFYGPIAKPTAEHHITHLAEYIEAKKLQNTLLGTEGIAPNHHIAYMVVEKELMDSLRTILKPNRGQVYEEK